MAHSNPVHCLCFALAGLLLAGCASTSATVARRTSTWGAAARPASAPKQFAEEDEDDLQTFAKRGFFLGAAAVATTLENDDFDGQSGLVDPLNGNQFILPELDPGLGWGFAVGYRGKENSVQFTYTTSEHDDDFLGTSLEDEIQTYSLDFKHYFNVENSLQPYVLIGVTVPRIRIEQGAGNGGAVSDAVYQGLGANLGGGAALYLTPQLALFGEAFYRWAYIEDVRGLGTTRDIESRLDGSGFGARGGISFTF